MKNKITMENSTLNTIKKIDISQIKYTPLNGEVVQDTATGRFMIYQNNEWSEIKTNIDNSGLKLNLYNMNKQIIQQIPNLTDLEEKIELINSFYTAPYQYYLMYGKEISYFTLFHITTISNNFGAAVIDCLNNIGTIKAIDLTQDKNAIEIWISTSDDITTCLYLFPYDNGIVEI